MVHFSATYPVHMHTPMTTKEQTALIDIFLFARINKSTERVKHVCISHLADFIDLCDIIFFLFIIICLFILSFFSFFS